MLDLAIDYADLALVAADGQWRVEPGMFDLLVLMDAKQVLATQFEAMGEA